MSDTVSMGDDLTAALCHANCIEGARQGARLAGRFGEVVERDGLVLFAGGSDFPVLVNGVFRVDPAVPADNVVDVADEWFAERGRGWSLCTTSWADADADLIESGTARGLLSVMDTPGMVCDERLADAVAPDGVELRTITTQAEVQAYLAMSDLAYTSLGIPAGWLNDTAPSPILWPPNLIAVGAFDGEELLSGAYVLFSHGIAGIYLVGTAEGARGRGLGELVTRAVTNIGFDRGAPFVTLQASPMGEPVYRRMGYRELYRYACHARFV